MIKDLQLFNRHGDKLTAEASTLGWRPGSALGIHSHKTNRIVHFVFQNVERDSENEIICWNFHNYLDTDQPIRKVTIYND